MAAGGLGSSANHTGVRTPTPVLRKVSRLKYLALANWATASDMMAVLCRHYPKCRL